jgi:MFS family permease
VSQKPKKEGLHRNVWVASGTSFLTDISSDMLVTVLPLFLANVLGVRIWAVGAVEGLADTTASVLKLYSGWMSDRMRTRKWFAVTGYAISALAKPFYYIASSWGAVAAIRWGDRLGKGVRTAPRDALIADSTPANRRGLAFGLHRAADTGGAVVGLLITVWIVRQSQGSSLLLQEATFRKLVLWSLLPAFLGVIVLAAGAKDISTTSTKSRRPTIRVKGLGRGFAAFAACSVLFELGNSADAFLVLRAQERGLSVVGVLWILIAFNVVYSLISTPAGALADRVSRKWMLFAGWCVYAGVYLGFALAESATHVVGLYIVYGIYHGLVAGAARAMVADLVPADLRGTAYGTYGAAVGLVSLPASVLAGVLWEGLGDWGGFGPGAPFAFGAATAVLAAVILVVAVPDGPAEQSIPEPGH